MDIIYFFPKLNDAPAMVGKSILEQLIIHKDKVPFKAIKVFNSNTTRLDNISSQVSLITFSDLINYPNDFIIHIPISPNVFPNKKFLLTMWCIIKNKPLLIHYHGDIRKHFFSKLKYEKKIDIISIPSVLFMSYILKAATKVITHSYIMSETLRIEYGVENSVVIPNGIDDYWFEPLKNRVFSDIIDNKNINIFYHGRLSSEKGIDLLINAVGMHVKNSPKTILYIAGGGTQKEYLQNLCLKLNLSKNVVFLGNINRDQIKYFLKNVDLAIYPSRFDNFPLAILEALACANCPVYFSKNAGIYDFVVKDQYELNYFEPSVENIIRILSFDSDHGNLIRSQVSFANRYKWDKVFDEYAMLYSEIYNEVQVRIHGQENNK